MRTPDFLIVGAAKSGTTSLSNYLSEHPGIEIVSNRLEFFGEYGNPAFPEMDVEDYLDLFQRCPEDVVVGEKSVSYLYSEEAPAQIDRLCPDVRILMVLRDPVERAYSDYWHRRRRGVESLTFEEALEKEPQRIREGARFEVHYANYGLYSRNVERYLSIFGSDRVKVFLFDDLKESPGEICRECFEFLGVDSAFVPEGFDVHNRGAGATDNPVLMLLFAMARNPAIVSLVRAVVPDGVRSTVTSWMARKEQQGGAYPAMEDEVRDRLRTFFKEDVEKLQDLLGRDLERWLA